MENYIAEREMAHDIIKQACKDYVKYQLQSMGIVRKVCEGTGEVTYKKETLNLGSTEGRKTLKNIRREILDLLAFFRSDWFANLADYSGFESENIISRLNALVKKYIAEFHEAMNKTK